ncbi:iron-sulfur cluster repair di-iron protein, ric [Tuanshanicoccus lijuaniae]|uniref:iron-sulfur cluster repair di-iron protein, ric n=1 Tax=Aerococcaceae bacterium zg-1292 TaxID=2774330 RepID=UPI001935E80C|nr:iron-sulfur cluster repair di-iron protein, ric [Aerococcaceae bacterium zg-1292]MBF6625373.1 iron-sulfur cluster repair di-iron protein, ric [Aerococcaceae bacterium zg-BR9]MBF6979033.1 iron-sulfur cluster repair di-iron protein, ric [Aerococcaceae bacterium zg-BR22]MBS4456396.1 iron-sulfur cluster repair di-iron protein, ric [Aerococcaceae bacterium zg-A91]MBS4458188.1 iron-sulfur cluster repair di-iron protein, ric [Aerococcaceae bacterium zg-BR33]
MLKEFFEANDGLLDLYTQAITKAHGDKHPEVFEVRKIYKIIQDKIQEEDIDVSNEWVELRAITQDYAIPDDVCPTFTKTYQLLKQMDELAQVDFQRLARG